jgi:hypothetical protein
MTIEQTTDSRVTIVSYGGGTNSKAVLIGMIARKEPPPHAILFADTGGEQPHTYEDMRAVNIFLRKWGYPTITIVSKAGKVETLEESCLRLGVLPPIAYGHKTCSQKFKIEPQEKWANNDHVCRQEWRAGRKITQIVGYDFDELGRAKWDYSNPKTINRYPLIDWRWTRENCSYVIRKVGLPDSGKSSCFFCPNMRKHEILELYKRYPDLLIRALELEANARLTKIKGLGRRFSWNDFIAGHPIDESLEAEKEMPCGCYDGAPL